MGAKSRTSLDSLRALVQHPDVLAHELVFPFIRMAGEDPDAIPDLVKVLPSNVLKLVEREIQSAPSNDTNWSEFRVVQPGLDPEHMTLQYRLGVEAIRAFNDGL